MVEFGQIGGACYAYDDNVRALIHVVSGYPPLLLFPVEVT